MIMTMQSFNNYADSSILEVLEVSSSVATHLQSNCLHLSLKDISSLEVSRNLSLLSILHLRSYAFCSNLLLKILLLTDLSRISRIRPSHIQGHEWSCLECFSLRKFQLCKDRILRYFQFMKDLSNDLHRFQDHCQCQLDPTIEYLKLFEILHLELHA